MTHDTDIMKKVFLFKSSPEESSKDKYVEALESKYEVELIPTIGFEYCSLDTLWDTVQTPGEFSGIIFSSPRCVESLRKCAEVHSNCPEHDDSHPVAFPGITSDVKFYCIGHATLSAALTLFPQHENNCTSSGGNASSLVDIILNDCAKKHGHDLSQMKPLLYPCSAIKLDTLETSLSNANVPLRIVTVYNTIANPDMEHRLSKLNLLKNEELGDISFVFFSPSSIQFSLPYLNKVISHVNLIALGPTTKKTLNQIENIVPNRILQCEVPTTDALLSLLDK